jgi:hypothetical protein
LAIQLESVILGWQTRRRGDAETRGHGDCAPMWFGTRVATAERARRPRPYECVTVKMEGRRSGERRRSRILAVKT